MAVFCVDRGDWRDKYTNSYPHKNASLEKESKKTTSTSMCGQLTRAGNDCIWDTFYGDLNFQL